MEVYLPIVEVQINVILILFVSFIIGFLSGLFGVGGGFLMTPFLIFMGIPPAFAVANEANNILASSTSATLTHWFKKTMDLKIGWFIIGGGSIGTLLGIVTDGDIRRAYASDVLFSGEISEIMVSEPITISEKVTEENISLEVIRKVQLDKRHHSEWIRHVLIVNDKNQLVNIVDYFDIQTTKNYFKVTNMVQ